DGLTSSSSPSAASSAAALPLSGSRPTAGPKKNALEMGRVAAGPLQAVPGAMAAIILPVMPMDPYPGKTSVRCAPRSSPSSEPIGPVVGRGRETRAQQGVTISPLTPARLAPLPKFRLQPFFDEAIRVFY